jgi:hypothetical protein
MRQISTFFWIWPPKANFATEPASDGLLIHSQHQLERQNFELHGPA